MDERTSKSGKYLEQLASKCLEIPLEQVRLNQRRIGDSNCTYYWNPARGGLQMIMSDTGEMLIATSAITFDRLYTDYTAGKRNGEEFMDDLKEVIISKKEVEPRSPEKQSKPEENGYNERPSHSELIE